MKALVVVMSAFLISAPALAQPSQGGMSGSGQAMATGAGEAPQEAPATAEEGEGADRQICRRVETASGSRMSYRRLCMTARQWRAFNRAN